MNRNFNIDDERSPTWLFINPEDPGYPPELDSYEIDPPTLEAFHLLMSYVAVFDDDVACG